MTKIIQEQKYHMNEKIEWHSEVRNVKDLKHWDKNPRTITKANFDKLKERIIKRGFHDVLKIDLHDTILSGNQRQDALISLGIEKVNVLVPNRELTEQEKDEIALESNRNDGKWDFDILANQFQIETLQDIGFTEKELGIDFTPPKPEDDEVPEIPEEKEPISKLGDLYELGGHRILCGDATKTEDVEKLMGGVKADLIITDPPYNTGMEGKEDKKAWLSYMFNDKFSESDYLLLIKNSFLNCFNYCKDDCAFYVFIDWRNMGIMKDEIKNLMDVKNVIVWDKMVHGLGSDYKFTYEMIIVGKKGKPKIDNRFGLEYQDIWRVQRNMGRNTDHSTAKPIELLEKPIKHASEEKNIIFDIFLGSGSTLIACEKTNRICYGMEIDPHYIDVIVTRWCKYTGITRIKKNGQEIDWII